MGTAKYEEAQEEAPARPFKRRTALSDGEGGAALQRNREQARVQLAAQKHGVRARAWAHQRTLGF